MPSPPQRVALCAVLAIAAGCSDRRRPDSELGGLVHTEIEAPASVDLDRAATDVGELVRALAVPHHQLNEGLGPHTITASSSIEVSTGGVVVEKLSDKTAIAVDAEGHYRATADNDHEYGRHAIWAGGSLYLRPRYGKYHKRPPNNPEEPGRILDEMFSTASAYFDLLWPAAELSDRGAADSNGRAARKIEISLTPSATDRPPASVKQRGWRNTITVDAVSGVVLLDRETGAPLSVELSGTLRYVRGGTQYAMKLVARHQIEATEVPAITPPPAEQAVSAPTMTGEVTDRRKLLEGLSSSTK